MLSLSNPWRGFRAWLRRVTAAGTGGVLAAGMVIAAAGPAAAAPPRLAFTPAQYGYAQVTVGQKASQTFTLTNSGGTVTGLTVKLSGSAAFTVTSDTCPANYLGRHQSCTVKVQFAPASVGTVGATLTAAGMNPTVKASDPLTGTGASAEPHIYWANYGSGTIIEANLDGTGVTTLVSGQGNPTGVAVNSSHIYWANSGSGTIDEANLDGTGVTTLVSGQNVPIGVAVNSSHIYWAGGGAIMEANLDGTGVMTLIPGQSANMVAVSPQ